MVQTTTAINGCNAKLEVDDAGGTPTDVSGSANQVSLSRTRQLGEAHTFVGSYPIRVECKQDASLSGRVLYTTLTDEARDLLDLWYDAGGLRTIIFSPGGGNAGDVQYSGEYFLTSLDFSVEGGNADPVTMEFECMPSGALVTSSVGS